MTHTPAPPAPRKAEQDRYVGKKFLLNTEGLHIEVLVSKIRNRYGNVDAYVTPTAGKGSKWVYTGRLNVS